MSFSAALLYNDNSSSCSLSECPCKYQSMHYTIFTAAQYGDITTIIRKASQNRNIINQPDKYGYTALHYAAQQNHSQVVQYLLQNGAIVDANACGATPLHRACYNGCYESIVLLLDYGAEIQKLDESFNDYNTALHKVLIGGNAANRKSIIYELINRGGDVNIKNGNGYSFKDMFENMDHGNSAPDNENESHIQLNDKDNSIPISLCQYVEPPPTPPSPPGMSCCMCKEIKIFFAYTKKDGGLICRKCFNSFQSSSN